MDYGPKAIQGYVRSAAQGDVHSSIYDIFVQSENQMLTVTVYVSHERFPTIDGALHARQWLYIAEVRPLHIPLAAPA